MTKQSILPEGVYNNYNESFESRENFKIEGKLKNPIKMEVTMKHSTKGFFVILAIVMSLVLVQGVWAQTETGIVTGSIETISEKPNMIVVDGTDIYGVRFNYLCNQYSICLQTGEKVTIDYYVFECSNGDVKNMAYSIIVDDVTVKLRDLPSEP